MKNFDRLYLLMDKNKSYYAERITAQIEYAIELAKLEDKSYDVIENTIDALYEFYMADGVITKLACATCEKMLDCFSKRAKQDTVLCVAHGHIDMNWLWGYDETVSTTLATFRTMLILMNEYPDFTYSQSQASCYEIVEKFDKPMLQEIKNRIKEGRWEVSASTWVEADKNMTNGESLCRHYIYTKEYLSNLLEVSQDSLNIDFEPDTFGHNGSMPEIMRNARIKYYYHCRGNNAPTLCKWKAQNGESSVLVFREPKWYNWVVGYNDFRYVPSFCSENKISKILKVYGTGDHGGGATRCDLNKLLDMNSWAIMPNFKFSSYHEFFSYIENCKLDLSEIVGEQNYVFTGCYTSQSRIKAGNRTCERVLPESETYSMLAEKFSNFKQNSSLLKDAWKKAMFNQFHDILPGSGMTETREFASSYTQEIKAIAGANKTNALINLAQNVDLSLIDFNQMQDNQVACGGGAGYKTENGVYLASTSYNNTQVFQIFNHLPYEKSDICEITLWDFYGDISHLVVRDACGKIIKHQLINDKAANYWGHNYYNIILKVDIPACGFTTIYTKVENNLYIENSYPPLYERTYALDDYTLENDYVKVKFDSISCAIVSLYDKKNNFELVNCKSGYFRFINEDPSFNMTAWRIGRYNKVTELIQSAKIENHQFSKGELQSTFGYTVNFGKESVIKVKITLGVTAELKYDVECDFREGGNMQEGVPQLSFCFPNTITSKEYKYDKPFGIETRQELNEDQVGLSFVSSFNDDGKGVMLTSDSKYGFRCIDNAMNISLIRGSFDPDITPEYGIHKFRLSIIPLKYNNNSQLLKEAQKVNNNLSVISVQNSKKNTLAMEEEFIKVDGDVFVSSIKKAENSNGIVIRLAEVNGRKTSVNVLTKFDISSVFSTDLTEEKTINNNCKFSKNMAEIVLNPYTLNTILIY